MLARTLCALIALGLVGCSPFPTYAEHGSEAMDTVAIEAMFIAAAMDSMTPATMPDEAAENAASDAGRFFGMGCFETSVDGSAVTYTLTDCIGPFAFDEITGTVTVTYRMTSVGVGFDIVANNLTVAEQPARFTVAGDISTDVQNASITTTAEIVGPRGILVQREGEYRMRWGSGTRCAGIDGTFTSTVDGVAWETTSSEWRRCADGCPENGGMVTITSGEGSVSLTFDGSEFAAWDAGADGSGTIAQVCTVGR